MPDPTDSELREACRRENSGKPWLWNGFARDLAFDMIARALPAKLDRIAELGKIIDLWAVSLGIACDDRDKLKHANRDLETQLRVALESIATIEHERGCPAAWYRGKARLKHRTYIIQDDCTCVKSSLMSALSPQKETAPTPES